MEMPILDSHEMSPEQHIMQICNVMRDSTYLLTNSLRVDAAILYKYRLIVCTLAEVLQDAVCRLSSYRVAKKNAPPI